MVGVEGVKDVREVAREPARCTGVVQEKGAFGLMEAGNKGGECDTAWRYVSRIVGGGNGWRSEKQQ